MQKKERGVLPSLFFALLIVLEKFYLLAVGAHALARYFGFIRQHKVKPIVVSVGNIVVGGTGKTPLTLMLARGLSSDTKVAILSRGYKSPAEKAPKPIVLSRGAGPLYEASYCGDEPYLLSKNLPEVLMFVGRDRVVAAQMASEAGASVIILDDGMQHRRLFRDYDVVVVDGSDPLGRGHLLPRGFLRESPDALSRASIIIANNMRDEDHCLEVEGQLRKYSSAPIVYAKSVPRDVSIVGGSSVNNVKGRHAGIFCAIAKPHYFRATVEQLGIDVVDEFFLDDHELFDEGSLKNFAERCSKKGCDLIICTEKDSVKLRSDLVLNIPIAIVTINLQIIKGETHWRCFSKKLKGNT